MGNPMYLSRVRLRRTAQINALLPLLLEGNPGKRDPDHHLMWYLFAEEDGTRERDFLWRRTGGGAYLILSARPPQDALDLFRIDEPKPFELDLPVGAKLRFMLRACPVVQRRKPGADRKTVKHDVVMDALRAHASGERSAQREAIVQREGAAWLDRQAEGRGFAVDRSEVTAEGYRQMRVARGRRRVPMRFSSLDLSGILTVQDSGLLLKAITRGFGAARAFGCGLMLVRRP